jgi:hypothetical protein
MLDSLTRLGRAYKLATPASGRILSGGMYSTALVPPKRFLGAACNIENGGSLPIFATALVDTGSVGDTLIFEEYKGTSNAELRLDRKIASKQRSLVRMCANDVGVCGWPNRLVSWATAVKNAVNRRVVRSASRIVPRYGMRNRSMYWVCDSLVVGRIPTRVDSQYRSHRSSVHVWLV